MKEQLENWMNGGSYWDGVELYERYGESDFLKDLFRGSADSYNRKKLGEALAQLLHQAKQQAEREQAQETDEIRDLHRQAQALLDERTALKERARVLIAQGTTEGPELEEIAMALAYEIRDQLDDIYGRIEFWKANGFLPETERAAVHSIADLVKERNNLRTYICKGGKAEKMRQWKGRMAEIDQQLMRMKDDLRHA